MMVVSLNRFESYSNNNHYNNSFITISLQQCLEEIYLHTLNYNKSEQNANADFTGSDSSDKTVFQTAFK